MYGLLEGHGQFVLDVLAARGPGLRANAVAPAAGEAEATPAAHVTEQVTEDVAERARAVLLLDEVAEVALLPLAGLLGLIPRVTVLIVFATLLWVLERLVGL